MKILFFAMIFAQFSVAAELDKKVTVNGQCSVETSPDRGSITFVVSHLEADAKAAIAKSTALYEKLRTELKRTRAKDLELVSAEYSVQERKEWERNRNVSKGFEARYALRAITSEIPALGDLISAAAKLGIKETHSLNTFLSEPRLQEEKKKCLEIAARNAREKADTLVKSLNAKLGKVIQITEEGASGPSPMPIQERMMMKSADAASPSIEAQKQTISQNLNVTFAID